MPETVFLTEREPLVFKAARWLVGRPVSRLVDLSGISVVVPTAGAARRLRGELLRVAASDGGGLLPPRLTSPLGLLVLPPQAAQRCDVQLAWMDAIATARPGGYPALLSGFSDLRDPATLLRIAGSLMDVCAILGEAGLTPESSAVASACPLEEDRWREVAGLYERYRQRLDAAGLADPNEARIRAVEAAVPPDGIRQIVLAGVPDLNPLTQRYVERLETAGVAVSVLVDAPDCADARFDAWGRPDVEIWTQACPAVRLEDFFVLADRESEAAVAARLLGGAALCLADGEAVAQHEQALKNLGRIPYNPAGRPLGQFECAALATLWMSFCQSGELSALRALAEQPAFLRTLAVRSGHPESAVLAGLDGIRTGVLLASFADAQEFFRGAGSGAAAAIVRAVEELLRAYDVTEDFARLRDFLGSIYADAPLAEPAEEAMEALAGVLDGLLASPLARENFQPDVLRAEIAKTAVYGRHEEGAVELHGWLEAAWLPEEALVISGCSEGALPASVTGHPFLPDSLRVALGIPGNLARFARDVYLLHCLAASRSPGAVKLTLSRTGAGGEPAKPSRVLFRCAADELPDRVRKLFGPAPALRVSPEREAAWTLDVPQHPPPASLRVTAFGEYLECPFRFYLKNVLRMEAFDPLKSEMDALDFGIVLHKVVENFSCDEDIRETRDGARIEKFVLSELDAVIASLFGRRLTLPVRVQKESLRARLRRFAAIQAAERAEGWTIRHAELRFEKSATLAIGGLPVTASLDRVEIHERTGRRRILDYKTYRQSKTPAEVHIAPAGTEDLPEARFIWDGKDRRWTQLQLPLYRAMAEFRWPGEEAPVLGYFMLPEKADESAVREFAMDDPLFASAMRCAEAVASRVARGVFWPPNEVKFASFEDLFAGGNPADRVSPDAQNFLLGT